MSRERRSFVVAGARPWARRQRRRALTKRKELQFFSSLLALGTTAREPVRAWVSEGRARERHAKGELGELARCRCQSSSRVVTA